jgi:hypothetical protein
MRIHARPLHTGGRICNTSTVSNPQFQGFAELPIELGPEFIHGEKENLLLDYFNKHGVKGKPHATTMQLTWPNYLYFGKEGKLMSGKESEGGKSRHRLGLLRQCGSSIQVIPYFRATGRQGPPAHARHV